jgi:hypothetical protein
VSRVTRQIFTAAKNVSTTVNEIKIKHTFRATVTVVYTSKIEEQVLRPKKNFPASHPTNILKIATKHS